MQEETNYQDDFMTQAYQGAVQNGEQQDPNSLYADYMREEKVRNIISQINPDLLLEDIENRIRGKIKDRFSQEWRDIGKRPKPVSELLISNYISFLGSILNQNTTLSNFSNAEINNIMGMVIEYIRDDLSDNDEEYGFAKVERIILPTTVKVYQEYEDNNGKVYGFWVERRTTREIEVNRVVDNNEMTRIGNIICVSTFAVLKRAQNGMEARRVFGALKVTESLSPQGGKKGIFDFLKFGQN